MQPADPSRSVSLPAVVDEITLDVRIEESVPAPTGGKNPTDITRSSDYESSSLEKHQVFNCSLLECSSYFERSINSPSLCVSSVQDSFSVVVHYLGQEVLNRQIQGADIRITYQPSSAAPPTSAILKRFPRIPLPEPPSTLPAGPELQALFTLLPFMERGVVLTSTPQGIYGRRFCQGRVFWTGPHTTEPGLHKMERNTEPVLLFSKDAFKQRESREEIVSVTAIK